MISEDKAVSHVVSVLLLIMITIIFAIVLYSFVMGGLENIMSKSSTQPFSLSIDGAAINDTCITVYIGNSWDKDVTVDRIYVNKEPRYFLYLNNEEAVIPKNSVGTVYLMGSYAKGATYEIKVVLTSGHTLFYMRRYHG